MTYINYAYIKQDITFNEEEKLYKTRSSKTNENK